MLDSAIINQDLQYIFNNIENKDKFAGKTILITGCAGFIGFYLLEFFSKYHKELEVKKIIGLDNFLLGKHKWIENLEQYHKELIELITFDITNDDIQNIETANDVDFIIHLASIASPTFYRKYPIETMDANIWGLRKLLEFYKNKNIDGFLFFSSSEIYGDPHKTQIPTNEEYRGNVACIGPRACYDEAKRFGETMCFLFSQKYNMPIGIVRPFNNYGPGMNVNDKRVPADFAKAILENKDIEILSDGSPTRTFCYISDAIVGYLKVLLYGKFDYFNIGMDKPEISINELAKIYKNIGEKLFGYSKNIVLSTPNDLDYLKDNPNRRCPDINKARTMLKYNPQIMVYDGVERFLTFLSETK